MILDSSAVLAILRNEPDAALYSQTIQDNSPLRISAATLLESSIVIDGSRSSISSHRFDEFFRVLPIVVEPFTAEQARIARAAYRDFGKGSGHPARLNFGDCIAYALAKDKMEPLLFKGSDFHHTDVEAAITRT